MSTGLSRRRFLQGMAAAAGAAAGTRLAGAGFVGRALAATEPTTVVLLHLVGGYNAIFASADSLVGTFGVTSGNYTALGNGLAVDNTFASSMSTFAKTHMAAIGVRHGRSSHGNARHDVWTSGTNNAALMLADAIGGTASLKAAVVGSNLISEAPATPYNGISFQSVLDMKSTIDALGGGAYDPRVPNRGIALSAMTSGEKMSGAYLEASPRSLTSLQSGYKAAIDTLKQPVKTFNYTDISNAYGLGGSTAVSSFKSKLAAAELMTVAGANVVSIFDTGWDSHGDTDGAKVRNKMTSYVLPAVNVFINRMVQDPTRNVVLAVLGDFARSLPGSDHQPNLTISVIGKYVKVGTTGKVAADVSLPAGTPSVAGMWAYLSAVARSPTAPFGANPHALVL